MLLGWVGEEVGNGCEALVRSTTDALLGGREKWTARWRYYRYKTGCISSARSRRKVQVGALDRPMPGGVWMSRECKRPDLWVGKLGAQPGYK